jgi:lipid-binding SYLF domain-containing protein
MGRFNAGVATLALSLLAMVAGCAGSVRGTASGDERSAAAQEARDGVRRMAEDTLQDLYAREPGARNVVRGAFGHAVFSNFGMKILVAGGGKGQGIAVERASRREIFMRMAEIQAGLGFGVKKFRLVWVFQTRDAFERFVNSGYEIGSQATLAAQASGQGAAYAGAVSVSPDVWLYQITDDGLAAELTVKGTRYYRDKDLN